MLDSLVESRIEEAIARGDFDDLPGAGRPLALDDVSLIPEDLRAAYRILKKGCSRRASSHATTTRR